MKPSEHARLVARTNEASPDDDVVLAIEAWSRKVLNK